MIHVYIIGPFTALRPDGTPDDAAIEANILRAEALAAEIIRRGGDRFVCVVPHSLGRRFMRGPGSPQYWYDATLSLLARCDAACIVPDSAGGKHWCDSAGSVKEVTWCSDNDVPCYEGADDFLAAFAVGDEVAQ